MSRKLVIGFDGKPHGSLSIRDGKLHAEGPNIDGLRHHAEVALTELAYRHGDVDRVTPQHVLDHLAERLRGRAHAHWETEEKPAAEGDKPSAHDHTEKRAAVAKSLPRLSGIAKAIAYLRRLPPSAAIRKARRWTGRDDITTLDEAIAAVQEAVDGEEQEGDGEEQDYGGDDDGGGDE